MVCAGITVLDQNLVTAVLSRFDSWYLLINATVYVVTTLVEYTEVSSGTPNEGWTFVLNFVGLLIWFIGTVWMLLWDAIIAPEWRNHWVQVGMRVSCRKHGKSG